MKIILPLTTAILTTIICYMIGYFFKFPMFKLNFGYNNASDFYLYASVVPLFVGLIMGILISLFIDIKNKKRTTK